MYRQMIVQHGMQGWLRLAPSIILSLLSPPTSLCIQLYTTVSLCSPCLHLYTALSTLSLCSPCLHLYTDLYHCISLFPLPPPVYRFIPLYLCSPCLHLYTALYHCISLFPLPPPVYRFIPLYLCSPCLHLYTALYHCISLFPLPPPVYRFIPVFPAGLISNRVPNEY